MIKNKIIVEPNQAWKRRVMRAYAGALARLEAALNQNTVPLYTEEGKTDILIMRVFGACQEGRKP